jgi:hypothetical protein
MFTKHILAISITLSLVSYAHSHNNHHYKEHHFEAEQTDFTSKKANKILDEAYAFGSYLKKDTYFRSAIYRTCQTGHAPYKFYPSLELEKRLTNFADSNTELAQLKVSPGYPAKSNYEDAMTMLLASTGEIRKASTVVVSKSDLENNMLRIQQILSQGNYKADNPQKRKYSMRYYVTHEVGIWDKSRQKEFACLLMGIMEPKSPQGHSLRPYLLGSTTALARFGNGERINDVNKALRYKLYSSNTGPRVEPIAFGDGYAGISTNGISESVVGYSGDFRQYAQSQGVTISIQNFGSGRVVIHNYN